jgi:ubiquinone/menaquinone biosynthesis C-methylase UbiE
MKIKAIVRKISNLLEWRNIPTKAKDLVLDVGSGDNPHVRADILCDAHLLDSEERSGKYDLIIDGRPFVFADACKLPFRDKAFDFIICRHLLEHMDNPAALLEELMRVGKAGYIESPSSLMERLYGWSFHRLLIDHEKDYLVIRPKLKEEEFGILPDEIKRDPYWGKLVETNQDSFLVSYFWRDKIRYRTEGIFQEEVDRKFEEFSTIPKPTPRRSLRWFITKFVRLFVARSRFTMDDILVCPECRADVQIEKKQVVCPQCQTIYSIVSQNCYKFC